MAASDWKGASAVLRRHVNLASSPVAVALLEESKTLLEHPQLRILHKTAPCHMAAYARYYREEGVVGASSEGVKCIWGATCLGLMKAPERLEEGLVMKQFTSDIVSTGPDPDRPGRHHPLRNTGPSPPTHHRIHLRKRRDSLLQDHWPILPLLRHRACGPGEGDGDRHTLHG
jgi:hypothetical protein